MTAAEEVNKMDIVLIGDWIIFCVKYLSVCSHTNVELQCALPTETVDRYSSAAWNQFLRFRTEIARTRDPVRRLTRYTPHSHSQ